MHINFYIFIITKDSMFKHRVVLSMTLAIVGITSDIFAMKRKRPPVCLRTDEQLVEYAPECHFDKLPKEIIQEILVNDIGIFEWNSLSLVDKRFHNLIYTIDKSPFEKFMGRISRQKDIPTKEILARLNIPVSKHYTNTIMPFNKFMIKSIKKCDYVSFEASLTKVDLEYMDRQRNTLLNCAAQPTFSITTMNDVLEKDSDTGLPPKTAAQVAIIKTLVQLNPEDCNVPDIFGNTPVMYEIPQQAIDIVAGYSDLSRTNKAGETPLYRAARNFRTDRVVMLLKHKADPFQKIIRKNHRTKQTSEGTAAQIMRKFCPQELLDKWRIGSRTPNNGLALHL